MNKIKRQVFVLLFILIPFLILSQAVKRQLDTNEIRNFRTFIYSSIDVSNNGKFVISYNPLSLYDSSTVKPISFQSLDGKWKMTLDSITGGARISNNNKYAFFKKTDKRLYFLRLGTNNVEYFQDVEEFRILPDIDNTIIAYTQISATGVTTLVVRDIESHKTLSVMNWKNLVKYEFSPAVKKLTCIIKENGRNAIYLYDINKKYQSLIWKGNREFKKIVFDKSENKVALLIDTSLWYYNVNSDLEAKELKLPMNESFSRLSNPDPISFSEKGKLLFFFTTQPLPPIEKYKIANTYSYLDGSFDMSSNPEPSHFRCCYNTQSGKFTRIEYDDETIGNVSDDETKILVSKCQGEGGEYYWNEKSLRKDYVVNIETDERKYITTNYGVNILNPTGDIVSGSNTPLGDIISTDLTKRQTRNLTSLLPIPLIDNIHETPRTLKSRSLRFVKFINNGKKILVQDHYDFWILDAKGESNPISITNQFGRRNHIVFSLADPIVDFDKGKEIFLSAFNEGTKDAGFYTSTVGENKDPELLSMGRYIYQDIKKAKDTRIWTVKRMSATEAPNFFYTTNFKDFKAITDVHPQKEYNWFTTELVNYTTKQGVKSQAILYKPDNLDSTKKYPVLFNFYENESFKLNQFLIPDYTQHYYFNIPMMLSRGYMVCVPDIHFTIGETAANIVDCVEGAADAIALLPYIDSTKYGASGGSFGGYGVNCLAAFSKRFKAIASISGVSDLISGYGNVPGLRDEEFENRQLRMGVSLSTDPERYLKNSPVAYAKDVMTPVLILVAKEDHNVNVQQGIEWFISLRREGKPSWLIQYNSEVSSHGIWRDDQIDLYIRMNQLFDHYLKNAPAPRWMTEGIMSKETRLGNGFEYNEKITTPPRGLLIGSK